MPTRKLSTARACCAILGALQSCWLCIANIKKRFHVLLQDIGQGNRSNPAGAPTVAMEFRSRSEETW
jgi:hypothetical protein